MTIKEIIAINIAQMKIIKESNLRGNPFFNFNTRYSSLVIIRIVNAIQKSIQPIIWIINIGIENGVNKVKNNEMTIKIVPIIRFNNPMSENFDIPKKEYFN